jgi:hypothetical protein
MICSQCGALVEYDSSRCAYCGATFTITPGSFLVVLKGAGNHPSLVVQSLQNLADSLLATGRPSSVAPVSRAIKAMENLRRKGEPVPVPMVLVETADEKEAGLIAEKIKGNGGSVSVEQS